MTTTVAAPTLVDALVTQLRFCHGAAHMNLDGLTPEESLLRPQPGGNCANWILGHITWVRHAVLIALGEPLPADDRLTQYCRGSDGGMDIALPLQELMESYDRLQPLFVSRLQRLTDAELTAKGTLRRTPAGPDATLGAALSSLVFHESYHVGQLGVARRLLGKAGAFA
ncbi:MAG TPA: DinB family protein [Thermoanaerobaculia bacterium]|nr:DinB family protein [Thermoanaerobaculia bacterium]